MFGTAISRFTDVRFKNSSNNRYSIDFLNKNDNINIKIFLNSLRETTELTIESILSRESWLFIGLQYRVWVSVMGCVYTPAYLEF